MNSNEEEVVVIDFKSIYVVSISENAIKDDVLAAYMRESGEGWLNDDSKQYVYWVTTHSPILYSIRRKIKEVGFNLIGVSELGIDITNWWANVYPIIVQIANVSAAINGIALVSSVPYLFVKWIRSKNKDKDDYTWVHSILCEDSWSVSLLSNNLSISEEEAKKLLKGFGYVWNSHNMLYVATENTKKLRCVRPDE